MDIKKSVLIVCCAVIACACSLYAQTTRGSMKIEPAVAFGEMLKFSQAKDYAKIKETLVELRPVSAGIQTRFGIDIETQITSSILGKEQKEITAKVLQMIFLDMKDLLSTILESKGDTRENLKGMLKNAMLDYSVLMQKIAQDSYTDHTKVLVAFKRSNEIIDAPSIDLAALSASFEQIETNCQHIVPELRSLQLDK